MAPPKDFEARGVTTFHGSSSTSFRYNLHLKDNKLSISLEDATSKKHWRKGNITKGDYINSTNIITDASAFDYVKFFQDVLDCELDKCGDVKRTLEFKQDGVLRLSFAVELRFLHSTREAKYTFELNPVSIERLNLFGSSLLDLAKNVAAKKEWSSSDSSDSSSDEEEEEEAPLKATPVKKVLAKKADSSDSSDSSSDEEEDPKKAVPVKKVVAKNVDSDSSSSDPDWSESSSSSSSDSDSSSDKEEAPVITKNRKNSDAGEKFNKVTKLENGDAATVVNPQKTLGIFISGLPRQGCKVSLQW